MGSGSGRVKVRWGEEGPSGAVPARGRSSADPVTQRGAWPAPSCPSPGKRESLVFHVSPNCEYCCLHTCRFSPVTTPRRLQLLLLLPLLLRSNSAASRSGGHQGGSVHVWVSSATHTCRAFPCRAVPCRARCVGRVNSATAPHPTPPHHTTPPHRTPSFYLCLQQGRPRICASHCTFLRERTCTLPPGNACWWERLAPGSPRQPQAALEASAASAATRSWSWSWPLPAAACCCVRRAIRPQGRGCGSAPSCSELGTRSR